MIDRYDRLYLYPADFDRSLAFYRDTLGWSVMEEHEGAECGRMVTLSGGATSVVLSERAPGGLKPMAGSPVIHLDIHDIDQRFRELPPGNHVVVGLGESTPGKRWFVVRDPDGALIAFEGHDKVHA
jgi:catechol 2,3-dioxygenase-like lactoylglutathione lyase family enzyme